MADPITTTASFLALSISAVTAWLTLFRRGTVRMTQPTSIFFGPDKADSGGGVPPPKVYLRTLLFSTSRRGCVIESMYVSLSRNETHQNFNIWVHGEREKLVRGSGLYIGETGVAANHHFLTPHDGAVFRFTAGQYRLAVFAHVLGRRKRLNLFTQELEITADLAARLEKPGAGLYFDWGPDSEKYLPHIDTRPTSPPIPEGVLALLEEGIGPGGKPRKPPQSSGT